jgi:MFS family permease
MVPDAHAAAIDAVPIGTAPASPPRPTQWGWVILLALILLIAGGVRIVMTPLQEAAQIELRFTDLQMGMLQGSANGLPTLVFAIPLGLAIDHLNRARVMLVLAILWTVGAVLTSFAQDFAMFFVARALVAIGVGGAAAVAMSMIADLCAPEKRGRVMVMAGVGILAGTAFAFAGGGALFGYFKAHPSSLFPQLTPWRLTALAFSAAGAALLVPVLLFREPVRHEREEHGNKILPALRGLASRWRFLVPLWIGGTAGGMAEGAAGLWAAPVLTRNFGLQPNQFGAVMGIMLLVAGVGGSVLGGVAADLGQKTKRRGGIMIGAVIATAIATPASAYAMAPILTGFLVILGVMMLSCTVTQVISVTALTILVPNEERGACMAVTTIASTLVGLAAVPAITLLGPALYGDDKHLPQTLAIIGVATGIVALGGYIATLFTAPRSWKEA